MNCPFCRNQIPDGAEFCPGCGANLSQQPMNNIPPQQPMQQTVQQPMNNVQPQQPVYNNTPNEPKKGGKKGLLIVLAIVIIALIGFGVYYFMNKDDKQIANEQNNTEVNQETEKENNNGNNNQEINVDPNTNTTYDENGAFLFSIEDVFTITGRGTVVTGQVLRGKINVNDEVQVIGLNHEVINTTVTAIEMFRETKDYATVGDNAGLLLKDVSREEVERGQVVIKPNSMGVYTKFKADIYVLTKEEGGRHTPFFSNYQPQFYFRTTDITGTITLPDNMEMVMPGDNVKGITVELKSNVAMEVGTEFSIREGGRTVGKGTVTAIN